MSVSPATGHPLMDIPFKVRNGLPDDGYQLHRIVYDLLAVDGKRDFLFTPITAAGECGAMVLVRSRHVPPELREAGIPVPAFDAGDVLRFELTASPMWKAGKRTIPMPGNAPAPRIAWLDRQGLLHGFRLLGDPDVRIDIARYSKPGKAFSMERAVFTGTLAVTDAERFGNALEHGIGRARGMGHGLMRILGMESGVC